MPAPADWKWFTALDVMSAVDTCDGILGNAAIRIQGAPSTVREALVTLLLINLHDLLQKANAVGMRVSLSNDITDGDVTDLVSRCRNCVCHLGSSHKLIGNGKYVFNTAWGATTLFNVDGIAQTADYPDDVAYFWGNHRLYLQRHLTVALNQIKTTLLPFAYENG